MKKLRKKNRIWLVLWIILTFLVWLILMFASVYIFIGIKFIGSISTGGDFSFASSLDNSFGLFELIALIIVIIISKHLWNKFNAQCESCKRWGALELANTKILQEASIYVSIDTKQKNINGETIGSQEQYIPGKRIQYQDTYKCKYCGTTESYVRTVDKASI